MSQSPATRYSLILRLHNRDDAEAWNAFVEIYEPIVYRMMVAGGLQTADAIEQTQEVMAAVAQAINRWTPDANRGRFRTWLYRVAKNILADFWKQTVRTPLSGLEDGLLDSSTPVDNDSFDPEFQRQVFIVAARRVKPQVSEKTWDAFWKSSVEHEPIDQVAKSLAMSPGSIYVARSRVMKKLQDAVQSFLKSDHQD